LDHVRSCAFPIKTKVSGRILIQNLIGLHTIKNQNLKITGKLINPTDSVIQNWLKSEIAYTVGRPKSKNLEALADW